MEYILLCLSVLMLALYNTLSDVFSKRIMKRRANFFLFNTIISAVASTVFLVLALYEMKFSIYTLICGLVFAGITLTGQFASTQAMRFGSMACTVMFNSCGMILPALAGILFWHEEVSWIQICGAVIVVLSFIIGADLGKKGSMTLKWFGYAFLLFICAGMTGIVQKVHQSSEYKDGRFLLLFIAFFVMGIVSYIMYIKTKKTCSEKENTGFKITSKILVLFIVTGLCLSFVHPANLYLSGKLPSVFFFPIINGVSTILCGLISVTVMKEKLERMQAISFIIGTVGIIALSLG